MSSNTAATAGATQDPAKIESHKFNARYFPVDLTFQQEAQAPEPEREIAKEDAAQQNMAKKPEKQEDGPRHVYVNVEVSLSTAEHEELMGSDPAAEKQQSKALNHLFIFADNSSSMRGEAFDALQMAMKNLSNDLFDQEDGESNVFDTIHTIYYNHAMQSQITQNKQAYLRFVEGQRASGCTDFNQCFSYVENEVSSIVKESKGEHNCSIIFLTDGCDTCNGRQGSDTGKENFKKFLNLMSNDHSVNSCVYTLGFTEWHDANLLNGLAQSGSQMGNFIFIDTQNADYVNEMKHAMGECLGMAAFSSGKPKMTMQADSIGFKTTVNVETEYSFAMLEDAKMEDEGNEVEAVANDERAVSEKSLLDEPNEDEDEIQEEAEQEEEIPANWTTVKYSMSILISEEQFQANDLTVHFKLGKVKLVGKVEAVEDHDFEAQSKRLVQVQLIDKTIFELIQKIQDPRKSKQLKDAAHEAIKKLDKQIDLMLGVYSKLKDDREMKKKLVTSLQGTKEQITGILDELRKHGQNLAKLSNRAVAQLNNKAYKAINKPALKKMLAKRSTQSQALYKQNEKQLKKAVAKMDLEKIKADHKELLDSIGDCPLTCQDVTELMADYDCMCICLSVQRPEAAIADPSRLVINDVLPTYVSADTFLKSARHKLQHSFSDGKDAHGGFQQGKKAKGQRSIIIPGLGRENVNGIMPLFLFKEHWSVARRKCHPIFAFMCTLDISGYTSEQFETVPFLVLNKLIEKVKENPSEANKKMLDLVMDTCIHKIKYDYKQFTPVFEKIVNFAYQPEKISSRTQDVVKSITVLASQFFCLLQIDNFADLVEDEKQKEIFADPAKLKDLKRNFIRHAVEEIMRRCFNTEKDADQLVKNLQDHLFEGHNKFVEDLFKKKEEQICKRWDPIDTECNLQELFDKYKGKANKLRRDFGYGIVEAEANNADLVIEDANDDENIEINDQEDQGKTIDFKKEVKQLTDSLSFNSNSTKASFESMNENFKKHQKLFMSLANKILQTEDQAEETFQDLYSVPLMMVHPDNFDMVTAIQVQNAFHQKNNTRVDAITGGHIIDFKDLQSARGYLVQLLTTNLMNRLMTLETKLSKKLQAKASENLSQLILKAPDQFTAAILIKENSFFMGRGDFSKVIDILGTECSSDFKDIANKLALIKTGYFYRKGVQADLNDASSSGIISHDSQFLQVPSATDRLALFSDKQPKQDSYKFAVNYKRVFRIWSKHIKQEGKVADVLCDLTLCQLRNVFPEFRERLRLYDKCCDAKGKVVRNFQFYQKYKKEAHYSGKRGSNQDKEQLLAKRAYLARQQVQGPNMVNYQKKRDMKKKPEEANVAQLASGPVKNKGAKKCSVGAKRQRK